MWPYFQQNLPPQLSDLPQAMIEQYFDDYYQGLSASIPSAYFIDETSLGPEVMAQIEQARQYLSYAQVGYYALLGFMALLVLGIILINKKVKDTTRGLGVPLLMYGAFEYAGIWVARYLTPNYATMAGVPPSLQSWLTQLVDDLLAPLEVFSLGLLFSGLVLLIVSFVYRPRHAEEVLVGDGQRPAGRLPAWHRRESQQLARPARLLLQAGLCRRLGCPRLRRKPRLADNARVPRLRDPLP